MVKYWSLCIISLLILNLNTIYAQNCEEYTTQFEAVQAEIDEIMNPEQLDSSSQIIISCDRILSNSVSCDGIIDKYYLAAAKIMGKAIRFNALGKKNIPIYNQAIKWFSHAAQLIENMSEEEKPIGRLANAYKNIGIAYQVVNIDSSEIYFEKAISALDNQPPTRALALVQYACSEFAQSIGEFERSIEHADAAYQAAIQTENIDIAAQAKNQLGILYNILGNSDLAIFHLREALNLAQQNSRKVEPVHIKQNLGNAFLKVSQLDRALEYYQDSEQEYVNVKSPTPPGLLNNIAVVYIRKARQAQKAQQNELKNQLLAQAQIYLEQAIKTNNTFNSESGLALNYDNLGDLFELKNDYQHAQTNYDKAIKYALPNWKPDCNDCISEDVLFLMDGSGQDLFTFLGSKAKISLLQFQQTQQPDFLTVALQTYHHAFEVIHVMRNRMETRNSRIFWIEEGTPIFEGAIKAALANKDTVQAFQWSEKARASLLYTNMREREAMAQTLPVDLQEEEQKLSSKILRYERSYREEPNAEIANKLRDLRLTKRNFIKKLEQEYPQYFQLKYAQDIVHPDTLAASLDTNSCLVEYFMGENELYIFIIDNNKLTIQLTSIPEQQALTAYRRLIQQNGMIDFEQFSILSQTLSQQLIKPLVSNYSLPKKIVITPHGELGYIPFETLTSQETDASEWKSFPFLIKSHTITYSWSATIWWKNLKLTPKSKPSKKAIVYAPIFSNDRYNFPPLFNNQEEAQRISEILNASKRIGADAKLDAFKTESSQYNIIHLATHGGTNPLNPLDNYIAFSTKDVPLQDSCILYMSDLYGLQLSADLVVLSACETGYGNLLKGEGIASMARAFTYAGARSSIMSFWKVDDFTTKNFMIDFYTYIKTGMSKDEAIQQVKVDMIANGQLPFYWAAFVLQGNPSPISLQDSHIKTIIASVVALLLTTLILFYLLRKRR